MFVLETKTEMSFPIRTRSQYDLLVAISLVEKARYLAEACQQLSFGVLTEMLPSLRRNLAVLRSVRFDCDECNFFLMDFQFCLRACVLSYERLVRVVEASRDNESLFENFCRENGDEDTLSGLCSVMDAIWHRYWQRFHVDEDKTGFLQSTESKLVKLSSKIGRAHV